MIILKDSIEIKAKPDKIFKWLKNLDKHYKEWHPDHVKCCWIGKPAKQGSTLCYEEYLHGDLHKIRSKITKIEENKGIEFRNLFPISIICPKGSFIIEPKDGSCIFTANLSFRFANIFSKLVKDRVEAIKKHMREEGKNLKRLLEKGDKK